MEIYQPAYLFTKDATGNVAFAARPTISSSPTGVSYGSSFTVQTPDATTISSVALIRNGSPTHAFDQDQRFVSLSFTAGSGALSVTAPPNGNIAPPGYYMLFLVDSSGVPSVAKFVQVGAQPGVPAVPMNVMATAANGQLTLSWSASSGATSYNVKRSTTSGGPYTTVASPTTTSYTDAGLTNGTTYFYVVSAVNTAGESANSSQVSATPASPDFAVSATPSSQNVTQGNGTSYTVSLVPSGGFTGAVGLSVSGLPQGATATFNPTSVTTSGSSTLNVSTVNSTPAGSYLLTITATSGALTHAATVTLVVNAPGSFTISATPPSQTVSRGSSTQFTIAISAQGSFSGTVNLTVSGLPPKTTSSFNPKSVIGSGSSTLKISPNPQAPVGTYTLTIKATSGSLAQSATITLIIK
jgi:hypothetical protein